MTPQGMSCLDVFPEPKFYESPFLLSTPAMPVALLQDQITGLIRLEAPPGLPAANVGATMNPTTCV